MLSLNHNRERFLASKSPGPQPRWQPSTMSGLEVVGSIASVIQLAGAVYAISKTLYEVGDALSNAPSDIKGLARDLETFSEELHLLSSLLDGKHRYSDRVYSLTVKIIGDCATICVKIDRILKKLRSGIVWARVKWLYKEKEIMKLLTRLRDLKLSFMGVLSMLGALKADRMLDAMGVPNKSLLQGQVDEGIAEQTTRTRWRQEGSLRAYIWTLLIHRCRTHRV